MFVNEYVSEVDIVSKKLDELCSKYDKGYWKRGRPTGFKHTWTIDRELSAYLVLVRRISHVGTTGKEEVTNRRIVVLGLDSRLYEFEIDKHKDSSVLFTENPVLIKWIKIRGPEPVDGQIDVTRVLNIFKSALGVYGQQGVYFQAPNTKVEFDF